MMSLGKRMTVLLTAVLCTAVASAELLPNPGFDDLNSDLSVGDGWGAYGAAGFHAFFGADNPHASLFSDNPGNTGGVYYLGIPGSAGIDYQFDLLDVRLEDNIDADLYFGLEFYEGDDATQISKTEVLMDISTTGDGLSFSMNAIAPAGTAYVRPIIRFDNVRSTASGQENAFVFQTSLTPEPGTLVLLSLTGLGLLRRR